MESHVYKHWGCHNHKIDDEIIDENLIVLMESGFQISWMETYDWFMA
jgi:hypothetical protein